MDYCKGSIIHIQGTKFKDSNSIDYKMAGHPVVIPIRVLYEDENIYYFTMTSDIRRYARKQEAYYPVIPSDENGLRKPSYINIEHVYKKKRTNIFSTHCLSENDYKRLMDKFYNYEKVLKDDDYKELIEILEKQK